LRPDRILGCFYVNPNKLPLLTTESDWSEYENERQIERLVVDTLNRYEVIHQTNVTRIDTELDSLWQSVRNHRLKEQNKTLAAEQEKFDEKLTVAGRLRKSTVTGRNSGITSRVPSLVVSLENIFHHRPQASRDSSSNNNRSSALRAAFRESQSSSNKRGVEMSTLSGGGGGGGDANQTMESNSNPLVAGKVLEDYI